MPQLAPVPPFSEPVTVAGTAIPESGLPTSVLRRVHDRGAQMLDALHKRAEDMLDYYLDLRRWLEPGEVIVDAEAQVTPGTVPPLAVTKVEYADTGVVVWAAGGQDGGRYMVRMRVTTSAGRVKAVPFSLAVSGRSDAYLFASAGPAISRVVVGVGPVGEPDPPTFGYAFAVVVVELSRVADDAVTVMWETEQGTAHPGLHYEAASGVLTFAPGERQKSIAVKVLGRPAADAGSRVFSCAVSSADAIVVQRRVVVVIDTLAVDDPAEIPTLDTLTGYEVIPARVGRIPVNILVQALAGAVQAGADGRTPEFRATQTHMQWRYDGEGADAWRNLYSLSDLAGPAGDDGREVEIRRSATHVQWRIAGDQTWIDLVALSDLIGPPGEEGADGREVDLRVAEGSIQWRLGNNAWASLIEIATLRGEAGRNVELRQSGTHLQWRLEGDVTWMDLVALTDLKGGPGEPGEDGADGREAEFRKSATHVQWRLEGGAWLDLIALADLRGAPGDPGEDGADGREVEIRKTATHLQWRVGDGAWANLVALADITGPKGNDGTSFTVNATGPLAGRSAYDGEDDGYAYLDTDNGHLYLRQTSTPGVWSPPIPFGKGEAGQDGDDGVDGREIELRKSATHLQWRLAGETLWIDLVSLADIAGPQGNDGNDGQDGADGREVAIRVGGGHIQWQREGDAQWADLISLADLTGNDGDAGEDGKSVEIQKTVTHIQWRLEGGAWQNLVTLAELTGLAGADGREAEFRVSATHIQWRLAGDGAWTDLIALSTLVGTSGDRGEDGADGKSVELQKTATHLQWRQEGGAWANIIALSEITGPQGVAGDAALAGTSTSNVTIGAGSKTFTTQAGKAFAVGTFVMILSTANPTTHYMSGQVTAYSGTALTVAVSAFLGSGSRASWSIRVAGAIGAKGDGGENGKDVEIQKTATHVQWRPAGGTWQDLIALADLRGADGNDGQNGNDGNDGQDGADGREVEIQTTPTHIQWRLTGGAWLDLIALSALRGEQGDTPPLAPAAVVRAGTDTAQALGVKATWDAHAPVALTDAATIAVDLATGINFAVTVAGNRTLGNPTNVRAGMHFTIYVTISGTRTLSLAANWKSVGGDPPTTGSFLIAGYAYNATTILYSIAEVS